VTAILSKLLCSAAGKIDCHSLGIEKVATRKPNATLVFLDWNSLGFVNLRGDPRLANHTEVIGVARHFGTPPKCRSSGVQGGLDTLTNEDYPYKDILADFCEKPQSGSICGLMRVRSPR
jgi:hypothetical protein